MGAVLNFADTVVKGIKAKSTSDRHRINLIPECLKHPHEFLIHFITVQPHLQAISKRLKFGVIMLAMNTPAATRDLADFTDAHSASISRTLNTTRCESIKTTTVLAAPASSGTIMLSHNLEVDNARRFRMSYLF